MRYQNVIKCLKQAGLPVKEIVSPSGGRAAVTTTGGALVGMCVEEENIPYVNEAIAEPGWLSGKNSSQIGGLRLWFAPEYAYFWKGEPDARTLANYNVQEECDPGSYAITHADAGSVRMEMTATLEDFRDGKKVKFSVERVISATPPPVDLGSLGYMGVRLQHRLEILRAPSGKRVDLWHLLQMPAGSSLLVPTRGPAKPLIYFNAFGHNDWQAEKDALRWNYRGTDIAKLGLDISQVTGRAGVLRPLPDGRFAAMIWQFPVSPGMAYVDGSSEALARNQILQAWDGFGFGELEYHSPSASAGDPIYAEHSLLWCFCGSLKQINRVALELLGRTWIS